MTEPEKNDPFRAAERVARFLQEAGVDYAIGGAVAMAAYGVPRMTADLDLTVYVEEERHEALFDALERAGCLFDRRTATAHVARIALFTVRSGGVGVDLFVAFHPHHHEGRARRRRLSTPATGELYFLSAEDLVVHKLALGRDKDRADLEALFAVSGADLDLGYVRRWARAILPAGDARLSLLEQLARRYADGP